MRDPTEGEGPAPPLVGTRVLDLTLNLPGPYAGFILASMGAEVIKVEPPRGDPARSAEPLFTMVNRGKRSLVLDLKARDSQPVMRALVERADVMIEGFRPGVMDSLGWGWEEARRVNPRLVHCSISAYGRGGGRAESPGHDLNLQALAGVCHLERDGRGVPKGTLLPIADLSTSLAAVASICGALSARGQEGGGCHLDVAMGDAVLSWAQIWGVGLDMAGEAKARLAPRRALSTVTAPLIAFLDRKKLYAMPHYGVYRAGDGRYLALGIVDEGHFWRSLCDVLGLGPLASIPVSIRILSGAALRRVIAIRLRGRPRADWLTRLEAAGVPASPVLSPEEAAEEPHFRARGIVDSEGRVRAPVAGATHLEGGAPLLGEHGPEILAELGF